MAEIRALTGLRGVAALAVLVFHLSLLWPSSVLLPGFFLHVVRQGWLGVDLFFVLSGFVLALPFFGPEGRGRPFDSRAFVLRRWWRIAPPYYASIPLALLLMGGMEGLLAPPRLLPQYLLFAQNLTPDTLARLNPVYWTLAVEFQFYLLFPIMIQVFRSKWWIHATLGLFLLSLAWRWATFADADGRWNAWAGLQVFPFLGHFALGMGAARLGTPGVAPKPSARIGWIASSVLFGIGLPAFLMVPWGSSAQSTTTLGSYVFMRPLVAAAFAGIILATVSKRSPGPVATRLFIPLGRFSFSTYLLHVPIIVGFTTALPDWSGAHPLLTSAVLLPVVLVCSWVFYRIVEVPALRRSARVSVDRVRVPAPTPDARLSEHA